MRMCCATHARCQSPRVLKHLLECGSNTQSQTQSCAPRQKRRRPCHAYMSTVQRDIQANMRAILVDWLVEVSLVRGMFACALSTACKPVCVFQAFCVQLPAT